MPQIEVYLSELGAARLETGQTGGGDLVTTVEVNAPQLGQPRPNVAQTEVSQPLTLPDVQDMKVGQSLADLGHTLVTDLAGHQGETATLYWRIERNKDKANIR